MSMAPELRASISAGPALKTEDFTAVPPSSFWNRPFWRPTSGVACVVLPKKPILTSSSPSVFAPLGAMSAAVSFLAWEP